jgi:prepilin-type N-terminal cleavage/methylation domain-containing protein
MVIKKAFSMIELVIAIVVIGIVAASFPLILTQTSNNVAFAMQQEAILTAKTYMGTILSYTWDSSSIVLDIEGNPHVVVLSTNNAVFENPGDPLRKGHVDQEKRRVMAYDAASLGLIEVTPNMVVDPIYKSINNYKKGQPEAIENLTVVTANNDSIVNIELQSEVDYVNDGNAATYIGKEVGFNFDDADAGRSTNIKMVTVRATSPGIRGINVTLRAYTSNIGELELKEGVY